MPRAGGAVTGNLRSWLSESPEDTDEFGYQLARRLKPPVTLLLSGALGVGKTTLTRGLARGFGLDTPEDVSSPSFTLVNRYQGDRPVYHVDLYRLEGARDLYSIGLDEILQQDAFIIIEWSERLTFPIEGAWKIRMEDAGSQRRSIEVTSPESIHSPRARRTTRRKNRLNSSKG